MSALHVDRLSPDFICCRVLTRPETLKTRRADLVHFLRAQLKAYRFLHTHPEEALPLVNKSIEVDSQLLRNQLFEDEHLKLEPDPAGKRVEEFYDSMKRVGYIEGKIDIRKQIDTSLYREALRQEKCIRSNFPMCR